MARVKAEVARIEEEFNARLEEESAKNAEGLVDQVDGYLGYVAEQWMTNNELALESGMKAEILEGFVGGLKGLFEEHYIDIPEERFDVIGSMEETISELEEKLNEAVASNVEMTKVIAEATRQSIIAEACEGLSDTQVEKFTGLAEELSFEDEESFTKKVSTIRENYFSKKEKPEAVVESVVTDEPVEVLTEEKKVELDPRMAAFVAALNKK
jgi:DNA-binding SARP family transcriptional activator